MSTSADHDRATVACRIAGADDGIRSVGMVAGDGMRIDASGLVHALRPATSLRAGSAQLGPRGELRGGWYRIEFRMRPEDARIFSPSLSVRMLSSLAPAETFPLPEPDRAGWVRCLLLFSHDVVELRLAPSAQRSAFRLSGLSLTRVSKSRAFLDMVTGAGGGGRPRRVAWAGTALRIFLRRLLEAGLGVATTHLYRAYRAQFVATDRSYAAWVRRYDTLSRVDLEVLREQGAALGGAGPLVSILLPVYNTPEHWLRRCLDSVLEQTYPRWELCICDDASGAPHVRRVLGEYAARDGRLKVVRRPVNGHISAASNSALELASGRFIALLDHDDELRPHALQMLVAALADHGDARLVYSDEDKIDARGQRFDPYFKPAWDRELLLGQNYLCHLTMLETVLVREVGGFRIGFEGSQDHDLFLRCTARLEDRQIVHVPRVLYHWRAIPGSTALAREEKDYAAEAGCRAVADHLSLSEPTASVTALSHGHYRVIRALPSPSPRVTIIIPTRDRLDLLETCVSSVLERTRYSGFDVLIIDNQSKEPQTLAYLSRIATDARVRVLSYHRPFNFSAINNFAVGRTDAELVCLLNNDIEVIGADWLSELASRAMQAHVGAVGALLYYPDDSFQHAGVVLGVMGVANHAFTGFPKGSPGHGGRARVAQSYTAVTGACLMLRRSLYLQVGGLDETLAVAFNDIDLCLRLRRAGYTNQWTPFAELYHHESASRGADASPEKAARFQQEVAHMQARWSLEIGHDPAYNPNLTLAATDFGLAFPPRGADAGVDGLSIGRTSIDSAPPTR